MWFKRILLSMLIALLVVACGQAPAEDTSVEVNTEDLVADTTQDEAAVTDMVTEAETGPIEEIDMTDQGNLFNTEAPVVVEVKDNQIAVPPPERMASGRALIFSGAEGWLIETTTPMLVELSQGNEPGTFEKYPGFIAMMSGEAVVSITSPEGVNLAIRIVITR
ncbi:MAG: hypothetical protein FJ040_03835 [Chloroflexi bacterium]|nr:hypothetical protein [Chloroflexota bacterium]